MAPIRAPSLQVASAGDPSRVADVSSTFHMHAPMQGSPGTRLTPIGQPLWAAAQRLQDWLVHAALPRWARDATDRDAGGFQEQLRFDGTPVDVPRRTRVAARQLYVYATAARNGWLPGAEALAAHAHRFLTTRLATPEGHYAASVQPGSWAVDARFDLYEQAFALFGLASGRGLVASPATLDAEADALRALLMQRWRHRWRGFHDGPAAHNLCANPHMHLLEAALAWETALADDPVAAAPWVALADDCALLALEALIDPESGALREHFDADWRVVALPPAAPIEPGHQFEWAWLLMRWGTRRIHSEAIDAAAILLDVGDRYGVDRRRGVAIDGLDPMLQPLHRAARLWPQTERIKACCLAARTPGSGWPVRKALAELEAAIIGLLHFVDGAPAGLWHETIDAEGRPDQGPSRTSSLYHLVGAVDELQRFMARCSVSPAAAVRGTALPC